MKLKTHKPRLAAFSSKRKLTTLENLHQGKRLTGHRLQKRNRLLMQRTGGLCEACQQMGEEEARRQGYTVTVDEWDHKVPLWKGGIDNETNLQGLCFKHHAEKTERERIERESGTYTIA